MCRGLVYEWNLEGFLNLGHANTVSGDPVNSAFPLSAFPLDFPLFLLSLLLRFSPHLANA